MKILIIEDEYALADAIKDMLEDQNYQVEICLDGDQGLDEALTDMYDLILLDVMLPGVDGFTILKECKNEKIHTPIIMLTAKSQIEDKLEGLESGADDYITKPFVSRELLARVKNMLSRSLMLDNPDLLTFGDLQLNIKESLLNCNHENVNLSAKELAVLELLLTNTKQIINKELMIEKIWGYDSNADDNNVEVYITFLRRKLKLIHSNTQIKAIRGLGYKLEYDQTT